LTLSDGAGDIPVIADGGIKLLGRHRESARGRRVERHDGIDARGNGGESGRVASPRGPPLQDDSRHGQSLRDAGRQCRQVFPGRRDVSQKLVPEGIEGRVPYKGPVSDVLFQMVGAFAVEWATSDAPTSTSCAPNRVRPDPLPPDSANPIPRRTITRRGAQLLAVGFP